MNSFQRRQQAKKRLHALGLLQQFFPVNLDMGPEYDHPTEYLEEMATREEEHRKQIEEARARYSFENALKCAQVLGAWHKEPVRIWLYEGCFYAVSPLDVHRIPAVCVFTSVLPPNYYRTAFHKKRQWGND